MLVAAIALLAMWGAALWFRVAQSPPGPVDTGWNALTTAAGTPATHAVAATLAVIGTGLPGTVLAVVLGLLVGASRGWAWGVLVPLASTISALDVSGMKTLAMRTRPDPAFGLLNAFPSGHTTYAALLGGLVVLLVRPVAGRVLGVVWVVAMAWSRTALHAHWLTDVLAGAVTGAATAVLLVAATRLVLDRAAARRPGGAGAALDRLPEPERLA